MRRFILIMAAIAIVFYALHKLTDAAIEWSESQPSQSSISGYNSVGYPYSPK